MECARIFKERRTEQNKENRHSDAYSPVSCELDKRKQVKKTGKKKRKKENAKEI